MLLRVRVKGLLLDLTQQTNVDVMPVPLIVFLHNITQSGNYVPNNFLTPYQLNRIDTDNYGALIDLDENQIKLIAGTYLFARILVMGILFKATDNAGQAGNINDVVVENFKVVSTIVYYIFMQVINSLLKDYKRVPDKKGADVYSLKLLPYKEVEEFLKGGGNQTQKIFLADMKKLIENWLTRIHLLISNADMIKKKQEEI